MGDSAVAELEGAPCLALPGVLTQALVDRASGVLGSKVSALTRVERNTDREAERLRPQNEDRYASVIPSKSWLSCPGEKSGVLTGAWAVGNDPP